MSGPGGAIILLYHRVTRLERDPQLLAVSRERFRSHLDVLRRTCPVRPVSEIADSLRRRQPIPAVAAITFDDGYVDNLTEAAPILREAEMPATVFATVGPQQHPGEFFWDDLERILLSPGRLPQRIDLSMPDEPIQAELGASTNYSADEAHAHRAWNVLRPDDPTPRHKLYRDTCSRLHGATLDQRQRTLRTLHGWACMVPSGRQTHRMMHRAEIRELARNPLFTIGGHTIDHPRLGNESTESQRHQILANRQFLAAELADPVRGFAYPFGTRHDYTAQTISLVKEAGYDFACSNFVGRVTSDTDPYQLPRCIVRDWDAREFERLLRSWFADINDS